MSRCAALLMWAVLAACGGDHPRDWGRADTAAMLSDQATTVAPEPEDTVPEAEWRGAAEVVLATDSAAGDAIFHRRGQCFTCHGAGGRGIDRLGPSLRDGVWLHSDGSLAGIAGTIANGVATPRVAPIAMPGFARQLTEEELRQVAAYVYAIAHPGSTRDSELGATEPGEEPGTIDTVLLPGDPR